MDESYYLYGFVVQWLGHAAVNRSIGVQVPAFPRRDYYFDDTEITGFIAFTVSKVKIEVWSSDVYTCYIVDGRC